MHADERLVSAFFPDRHAAERALLALPRYGISVDDVSLVGPHGLLRPPATEGGGDRLAAVSTEHPMADGAAVGSMVGGAVGFVGGMGLLLSGLLVLPAIGLAVIGPLVGALAGAGLNRHSKSLIDALSALGVPEAEARLLESRVKTGGILLAVAVEPARVQRTREVLETLGGVPMWERALALPPS